MLQGKSLVGWSLAAGGEGTLYGYNARTGERLEPAYGGATVETVDRTANLAAGAFPAYRALPRTRRAEFLRATATELEALGDPLIERVMAESGLPEARLRGELARTTGQLRFFAAIVEEGSWVDARIDNGEPGRKPLPKPDVRSMLRPLGPVVVFCASNFPLAFSVAGGDTASALAAGNPVVVSAHFSHPGTAEMCGGAIVAAAQKTGMPEGVFSLLFTVGHEIGRALVAHPSIQAAAFTGSRKGGLALAAIAHSRPEPIPFYAEMSSVNPVFILPHALRERGDALATGLHTSITAGVGQFCTNPGVIAAPEGAAGDRLAAALAEKLAATPEAPMLNAGILGSYAAKVAARGADPRVRTLASGKGSAPALFEATVEAFLAEPDLGEEVFGPSSVVVRYGKFEEALAIAYTMEGNLTATIQMAAGDESEAARLAAALETRVGRIVFNGYPTGVEVCQAMVHGGPYPATADGRTTSVGGRAIERFARPVCYQDTPEGLLPAELRDTTTRLRRMVDGKYV
ncbi:MAG: aldehyde dehydrogenase (NADP(+)) [Bryobacteraceae bacterium]|jgi:NADP-dependent aldehyde dehydrogenase